MKERPILFSAPMVRAILREIDPKSQTRRVVKLPYESSLGEWEATTLGGGGVHDSKGNKIPHQGAIWHTRTGKVIACPYGQPGDRLWVRETHSVIIRPEDATDGIPRVWYAATDTGHDVRWTPSIHMPRWASRILLEIVDVRAERLTSCSAADARAEGLISYNHAWRDCEYPLENIAYEPFQGSPTRYSDPVKAYKDLWESINGAGSWNANPWVWVIDFKQLEVKR